MTYEKMKVLDYSVSAGLCDPEHAEAFRLHIDAVLGEAPAVLVGKTYLVRGSYELTGARIARLCLSCQGTNRGTPAGVSIGTRAFEVTAVPLAVDPGKENVLDLVMFNATGSELGVRLRLNLETGTGQTDPSQA